MDQQAARLFRPGHAETPSFVIIAPTQLAAKALARLRPKPAPPLTLRSADL